MIDNNKKKMSDRRTKKKHKPKTPVGQEAVNRKVLHA